MDIAVIVASTGRPAEIGELLQCLSRQTKPPSAVILSVASAADLPATCSAEVEILIGDKGLTMQRNRGIEAVLNRSDIILFYDDDFVPCRDSLQHIETLFANHPKIVSATGHVLADGVKNGGISFEESFALVAAQETAPAQPLVIEEILWAYGCNMAFRTEAIKDLRFDENLVLHGWQEDMDYAARIARRGMVVRTNAFQGVHRGVNKGRSSGVPMGFSQIVNPVYLVRKGAMTHKKAATLILRNTLANHCKMIWPEPFVDRRGRVLGNWRGLLHLLSGRADPKHVIRFT